MKMCCARIWKTAILSLAVVSAAAGGQPGPGEIDPSAGVEQLTEGEARLVMRISRQLDAPIEQLLGLRAEGLGWGDVEMATLVAAHSGEPAENVVRLWKLRGRAWQAVGDELGIADVEALKAEVREED